MKILWVSPRWPLPEDSGAKIATLTLLQELMPAAQEIGTELELNILCLFGEPDDKLKADELTKLTQSRDNLFLAKKKLSMGSNAVTYVLERIQHPSTPYTVARCLTDRYSVEMQKWLYGKQWDFTIIDGVHAAALIDLNDSRFGRFIYRAHNVEADLWKQLLNKNQGFAKNQATKLEYYLSKKFEDHVCKISEMTLTVSEQDAQKFNDTAACKEVQSLYIGMSFDQKPLLFTMQHNPLNLLFVGRLDWLPNKEGLLWFLKEVWPEVVESLNARLHIIGSGDSDWLKGFASEKVNVLGQVSDLKEHYQHAHITLIPLFMGSGTRVKAIEAGSFGRSFISTALGVEGLPFVAGADYIQAETKEDWIRALNSLSYEQASEKGNHIFSTAEKYFEKKSLAKRFLQLISKLS